MTVKWLGTCVSGQIDILNHREAFEGFAEKDGRCRIKGRIVSLTKILPYQTEEIMSSNEVQFVIKTDSIEKPEEQTSLWQKLTDLFKK